MAEFVVFAFGVLSSNKLVLCGTEFESGGWMPGAQVARIDCQERQPRGIGGERSEEGQQSNAGGPMFRATNGELERDVTKDGKPTRNVKY